MLACGAFHTVVTPILSTPKPEPKAAIPLSDGLFSFVDQSHTLLSEI